MGAACGRTRPACGEGARSWAGDGNWAFSREGLRTFGQPVGGVVVGAACRNLCPETADRSLPGGWRRGPGVWAPSALGEGLMVPVALGKGLLPGLRLSCPEGL